MAVLELHEAERAGGEQLDMMLHRLLDMSQMSYSVCHKQPGFLDKLLNCNIENSQHQKAKKRWH